MGTVYEIHIYQVKTSLKNQEAYEVEVCWSVKQSPKPYEGEYLVELLSDAGVLSDTSVSGNERRALLSGLTMESGEYYAVRVSASEDPSVSQTEPVLQDTYEGAAEDYDGKKVRLTWNVPDVHIGKGECRIILSSGGSYVHEIPPYVRGMEILLNEEFFCKKEPFDITLTPYISDVSSGPKTALTGLFSPDYVVDGQTGICCRCKGTGETELSVTLRAQEVFRREGESAAAPQEPITSGPLSLDNQEPCRLSVGTADVLSREDYEGFVRACYRCVTAEAMYEILDFVSRAARQKPEDSLYFHCGLSETLRRADIRPGFSIRVEQALYQYQQEMGESDVSGFIGSHTGEYEVSLHRGKEMSYLEFDSFVSLFEEELYPLQDKDKSAGAASCQQVGAGVLDLCSVNMRQPYYRIQYPDGIFTSDVPPDGHPDSQVMLLAAPGWAETKTAQGGGENAALTTPYLVFRGRSGVTLLFTVTVNGREEKIPAGTTVEKLLRRKGCAHAEPEAVRLFRRNPYGKKARVITPEGQGELLWGLPLLHGDCIEV